MPVGLFRILGIYRLDCVSQWANTRWVAGFLPCDLVHKLHHPGARRVREEPAMVRGDPAQTFAAGQVRRNGTLSSTDASVAMRRIHGPSPQFALYLRREIGSAYVGCSRLLLGLDAGRGLRRELQHGRKLFLREACEQDSMTIRKFNRIVMRTGGLFVDLPENRRGIPHTPPRPTEEAAVCDNKSARKSDFGSRQKANRHFQAF